MSLLGLVVKNTLEFSLIALVALAVTRALRRRPAAVRHWILSCVIACGALTPLLALLLPAWRVPVDAMPSASGLSPLAQVVAGVPATPEVGGDSLASAITPPSIGMTAQFLAVVWAGGAAINLAILLAGMWRLRRVRSHSQPVCNPASTRLAADIARVYGVTRPVRLLQSEHPSLLVTWGILRPTVILPRDAPTWSEGRLHVVLSHELAHIQRGDWLVQIAAEVMRSIHWFNPLAWVVCTQLRTESEHAADDAVLNVGIEAGEYATHLVDIARAVAHQRETWWPAPAIVRSSTLERRITAMLKTDVNRSPLTRPARFVIGAALFAVAAVVASAQGALGTFSGSVLDPMNRMLPDAALILTNVQTGAKHEVRSDNTGRFEFSELPRGEYALEVKLPGFASLRGQITMTGQNVQQTLNLEVGTLQETINVVAEPSGAPNPAPPRARDSSRRARPPDSMDCAPTPHGGNIKPPMKLTDVRPEYPVHLANAGTIGTVLMEAVIAKDGTVRNVRVVGPAHPDFDAAAVAAVRRWEFTSTLLNCMPIEVVMKVTVNFRKA